MTCWPRQPSRARRSSCAFSATTTVDTLKEIGAAGFGDRLLIDVSNAVNAKFELVYPNASLAAAIQAAFPNLRVVKAFNTFNTSVMTNPAALSGPSTAFISGNDPVAKATVAGLHADLGWDPQQVIDLGGIELARAQEHYFYMFFALLRKLGTPTFNIAVVR